MKRIPYEHRERLCDIRSHGNSVSSTLVCHCQNDLFSLTLGKTAERKKGEAAWEAFWKRYRFLPIFSYCDGFDKKTGERYLYGKTFFGIPVGRQYFKDMRHFVKDFTVLTACCSRCQSEITVFDSRRHGYDAIEDTEERSQIPFADEKGLVIRKLCQELPAKVRITFENSLSYEEFCEDFGEEASEEKYANAFTRIKVTADNGKKTSVVLDLEQ